jgi:drug/metabolite transporter (DMT)-like permease
MGKSSQTALPYLLGTSLFYGLLIVIQKMGLNSGLEPLSFSFSRSAVIVLISLVFFLPQMKKLRLAKKDELVDLAILGSVSTAGILILFLGQDITTAINAGFLIRLTPLFVLPFAYVLLKEKTQGHSILLMLIMLAGAFLLITNGIEMAPQLGDILVILAAMSIAFQNVFAKKIMHKISTDLIIFCRIGISALLITLFVPVLINWQIVDAFSSGLVYIILTAILYVLSVICQYNAIKLVGPFITTTFFLSGSLFSAFFAYLLLGETLSFVQWIGVAAILLGGYCLIKKT